MFEIFFVGSKRPFQLPENPIEANQRRRELAQERAAYSHSLLAELNKAVALTPQRTSRRAPSASVANASPERQRLLRTLEASERKLAATRDNLATSALTQELERFRTLLDDLRPPRPVYGE